MVSNYNLPTNPMDEMTKQKPTFSLPASMLPAIKGWKVNEKYKIELTVIQKSIGEKMYGPKEIEARFEIVSAKEVGKIDPKTVDKKGYVKMHARAMKGGDIEHEE